MQYEYLTLFSLRKIPILIIFLIALIYACDDGSFVPSGQDCDETPNYTEDIKDLVTRSCAYADCHTIGASIGDYSTYDGMSVHFTSNLIEDRINNPDPDTGMPPDYAQGPIDLSEEELQLMNCWIAEGYPEN